MKNFFAVLVIFLIGPAIAPDKPPTEDKKWEECNDRVDAQLEQMSNFIKAVIPMVFTLRENSPPCSECDITEFGNMMRIGDATYKKISTNVTENNIKINTDNFTMDCTCNFKTKSGGSVEGVIQVTCKNFTISVRVEFDSEKNNIRIPKLEVTYPMNQQSVTLKCAGDKDYVTSCETAGNERRFDGAIKSMFRKIFPEKTSGDSRYRRVLWQFNCWD